MLPRLVATDLDGTLLRSDGTIDERTRQVLDRVRDAGIELVVCTARPARWVRPLALALAARGPAVCANGGVIWDFDAGAVLREFPIAPATAREVVVRLRAAFPEAAWAVERADAFAHEPSYAPRWPVPDDTIIDGVEALLAASTVKLLLRHPDLAADVLAHRARGAVGHLVEVTHSNTRDTLLEMSAPGVSKGSALAALCAERRVDRSEVIAFGDMPNDLPMLRWAGRGVAVANAHPDVLAAAEGVTAANDDGGVARVLEEVLEGS